MLVLERAAALAVEKARDVGVSLIRVVNVGPVGSAAGVAARGAVGPTAVAFFGPDGACAIALPGAGGLPTVYDPLLAADPQPRTVSKKGKNSARPEKAFADLLRTLATDSGWLVAAVSIPSFEPIEAYHAHLVASLEGLDRTDGLLPGSLCESLRRETNERGVFIPASVWNALKDWASRLGLEPPAPLPY